MFFFDTKECEWSDQEILLNGVKIGKIRGLKFKKSQEKEHLYAGGNDPIDIQRGNKKYEGTLTILKGALEDANNSVIAQGGEDITDAAFQIVCNYKQKGNRLKKTYTMINVEFTEFEIGMIQGDKFQEVNLPYLFLKLAHS